MTMKYILPLAAATTMLCAAVAANAASGYMVRNAKMYAGPGEYPEVIGVPQTTPVQIYGCIEGYAWCDVMWKDQRGWVRGDTVQFEHEGRRVVLEPGVHVDVPIINFEVGGYWDDHYRNRPFYRDRER